MNLCATLSRRCVLPGLSAPAVDALFFAGPLRDVASPAGGGASLGARFSNLLGHSPLWDAPEGGTYLIGCRGKFVVALRAFHRGGMLNAKETSGKQNSSCNAKR